MATQMNPAAVAGLSGVARRLVVEGTLSDADAPFATDQGQAAEQQALACAGFTGDDIEPLAKLNLCFFNQN